MHFGETNMLLVKFKVKGFLMNIYVETRIMVDPEATMSQVSQPSNMNFVYLPPAKMICLDKLEQTVLGLVKKTFEQASQHTGDQGVLSANMDIQSSIGQ